MAYIQALKLLGKLWLSKFVLTSLDLGHFPMQSNYYYGGDRGLCLGVASPGVPHKRPDLKTNADICDAEIYKSSFKKRPVHRNKIIHSFLFSFTSVTPAVSQRNTR